jgi:Putative zinc-finger
MECEKIREKFSSLLEGDLDPLDEKVLKEHLASCSGCQKDFETFRKTMNWLHSVDEVEAPDGFLTEIYQKMEDRKRMESRQGWVHWLSRANLPAQAVAMVAIIFVVLYITKMIPMETPSSKKVEEPLAYSVPLEKKSDEAIATREVGEKRPVEQKKAEPEGTSTAELKAPPSEEKKVDKMVLAKEIPTAAAIPAQEIIVRTSDQEKAHSELQGLVKEFGGEIIREEGHVLLASLPTASYPEFEKRLEEMTSPRKAEPAAPQQVAPRALRISPGAKEEESVGKGKEEQMGRSMADQAGRITVRILLIKE